VGVGGQALRFTQRRCGAVKEESEAVLDRPQNPPEGGEAPLLIRPGSASLIVAIDGPAGSGKTTLGRALGRKLGLPVVDTGLMYRAVTVEARRRGIHMDDTKALKAIARDAHIEIATDPAPAPGAWLVRIDGRDVTRAAADPAIAPDLARVAAVKEVRTALVKRQRALGRGPVIMLGRDIGTVVLPGAPYKFFLTASTAERTARRWRELAPSTSPDVLEQEVQARDRADSERATAPLRAAADAIIMETEGKTVTEVLEEVLAHLPARRPPRKARAPQP
jgi:cytidylate kinase